MDWYGILQLQRSSDEASIKKQYRKLALLLHPNKNKFAGAEAAFKLIGEANTVLTDQTKRSQYDMKTAPKPTAHPSKTAGTASVDRQYKSRNNSQNGCSDFAAQNDMKTAPKPTPHPSNGASAASAGWQNQSSMATLQCSSLLLQGRCSEVKMPKPNEKEGKKGVEKPKSNVRDVKKGVEMQKPNARDGMEGVEMQKPNVKHTNGSGTSKNGEKKRRKLGGESCNLSGQSKMQFRR
ncbi:hypothetical protein V6N13_020094 [Hibiscus sabdariffa]|uniref:J domain-containing protein n=1 Tax=Hibiscus sabdariffa TaxID=183260 RepID=A0ABR2EUD5_9ROSI